MVAMEATVGSIATDSVALWIGADVRSLRPRAFRADRIDRTRCGRGMTNIWGQGQGLVVLGVFA
eukprot:3397612-Prymnesium_polylepis.1